MLQVPPWRNFRNFRCILTPFNIIIAKWGDDRKSAFRLKRPPKQIPVAFQATGNFQRRPEIGDFALDFLAKKFPVPFMLPGSCKSAWYFLPVMFTSRGATMPGGLQCRSGLFNPGGGCKKAFSKPACVVRVRRFSCQRLDETCPVELEPRDAFVRRLRTAVRWANTHRSEQLWYLSTNQKERAADCLSSNPPGARTKW